MVLIPQIHEKCQIKLTKGIKHFKCRNCGEASATYVDGIDLCHPCCEKLGVCIICGKIYNEQKES